MSDDAARTRAAGRRANPLPGDEPRHSYLRALQAWIPAHTTRKQIAKRMGRSEATVTQALNGLRFAGLTRARLALSLEILTAVGASETDRQAWVQFHHDLSIWDQGGQMGDPPRAPGPGSGPARVPGPAESPESAQPPEPPSELPTEVMALLALQLENSANTPFLLPEGRMPPLSAVYVRQRLNTEGREAQGVTPARLAQDVLTEERRGLLVTAGPGGGKSTLVHQLVN